MQYVLEVRVGASLYAFGDLVHGIDFKEWHRYKAVSEDGIELRRPLCWLRLHRVYSGQRNLYSNKFGWMLIACRIAFVEGKLHAHD